MHLTFWQPIPSPHQRGLLEALASAPWVKSVRLRYENPLSDERRAQGWEDAEFLGVDAGPISPGEAPRTGPDQVNVFTGFNTHPGVWAVFQRIPTGAKGLCLVYAEAPELRGLVGLGRKIKYFMAAKRLGGRIHGVLALGDLGADFYRKLLGSHVPVTAFAYYDRSERDRVVAAEPEALATQPEAGDRRPEASERTQEAGERKPEDGDLKPETAVFSPQVSGLVPGPAVESPPPSAVPVLASDINLVINGLGPRAGSLSLSPASSFSPGFNAQLPTIPSPASSPLSTSVPPVTALPASDLSPQVSTAPQVSSSPPFPPRHVAPMLGKIGAVHSNTRRLLFVGQCIWRKGPDQLLVALAAMPPSTPPWVLDVVGTGTEVGVFMHLAEKLDLVDRVRFRDVVKGPALEKFYLRADLVILPSRWDGWGMAVNEALFAGVPVATTDRCGAASVIRDLPRCMVLPAKRIEEWPQYLSEWLEWGGAMGSDRARLQKAAESLTGEAGVELLRKTIEQARKRK